VEGARQAPAGPFAFFADVDQMEFVPRVEPSLHLSDVSLANTGLRVFDQLEECGRMLHWNSLKT
jgi:hypothetical protein